ncbi:MAG: hypothetical protein J5835_06510 [Bacteroidales bacterium]|nr:hypothetical protein [Bacteroidales bacterium]
MRKLSIFIAAAALLVAAFSCKEDDETTTKPSLTGLTMTVAPSYVAVGEVLSFTVSVSNITATDETVDTGVIGVKWHLNSEDYLILADDITGIETLSFTYCPQETGSYSISCSAYTSNDSCYSTAVSTAFRVIDPDASISGLAGSPAGEGKYREVTIGSLTWMAENLHMTQLGLPYNGCEVMNKVYGRYYTYQEALVACPEGWHLPTAAEWDSLGSDAGALMADATFLDVPFWKYNKEVSITNSTGFNALSVGYMDKTQPEGKVSGEKEYAAFWTVDNDGSSLAQYRYLFVTNSVVQKGMGDMTSLALSVRCVK